VRLLVFGGWGQLGTDLAAVAGQRGHEVIRPRHPDVDVREESAVRDAVLAGKPDAVIDAAAFHKVEACEADPSSAFAVNAVGARHVARAASDAGARSVYISTDYVFDGERPTGYTEDLPVGPVNVYGVTKAAGERLVRLADPASVVVRGSGLFGHAGSSGKGGNFVEAILARARAGEPLSVVDDLLFSPTSSRDMAERVLMLLESDVPPGFYHVANRGSCSWFGFARRILELARIDAEISSRPSSPDGVRRPRVSILLDSKSAGLGLPPGRSWEDALARYLHVGAPEPDPPDESTARPAP
jgi:dTDP-4-dehydrorhamnose reductase